MKIVISLAIVYAGFAASFVLNGFLSRNLDLHGYGDIQVALGIASIGGAL